VIIKTGRFGEIEVAESDIITFKNGIFGFPSDTRFCIVDIADDTLILWLQSLDNPQLAFPILEPKIFKPDYSVRLSATELRELELTNLSQSAVFSVLTIPADIKEMTANLKAPLVINLKRQIGRQVVLQENEYVIKHPMFAELRAHLVTMQSMKLQKEAEQRRAPTPISVDAIPPSTTVKSLQV
jgi:flagellar assembly factor FliW